MALAEKKAVFHIISHTHWDREWYLTFEQFRYRLIHLIDRLIELLESTPDFRVFHLDAQSIILDDYLEIRPQMRGRLERLVREGRILTGPWYVQNDLFLTSGESTVRNLMEGIRRSRELGGEMKVGYLPDHFGLIGQMPQLLRDVGINNSVFARGYDYKKHGSTHFQWAAPDGTIVLGVFMPHWYNNAQRLPLEHDDLRRTFEMIKDKSTDVNPLPHYLLMNGVDHLEAQEDLPEALAYLRSLYGHQYEFKHDVLPAYIDSLRQEISKSGCELPLVTGELREGPDTSILAGTLSSRVYIKQANMNCHDLLEKWLEPLSSWCAVLGLDSYDQDYLNYLWKLYMKNHPHDSICGCSTDAVHEHMMDRYESLLEAGESILQNKMEVLARQIDKADFSVEDQKLLAVNTSQLDFSGVITSTLYFPVNDEVHHFAIEDAAGASVPYRLLEWKDSRIRMLSPINLPNSFDCKKAVIEWRPNVPALGYAVYAVRPHKAGNKIDSCHLDSKRIENGKLLVEFRTDGTFTLTDKVNGFRYNRLGSWEEQGDQGNLYTFSPAGNSQVFAGTVEFTPMHTNKLYSEIGYRFTWKLPSGLNLHTRKRKRKVVKCIFDVKFRLETESEQLKIIAKINNQAENHRFRFILDVNEPMKASWVGAHFDLVKREPFTGTEWSRSANVHPFWKCVAAETNAGNIACFAKGLHEYEMLESGRKLAITLIRGVHAIHFSKIPLDEDYQIMGQCLGDHTFEFALRSYGCSAPIEIYQEAEQYHQGVRQHILPIDELKWLRGRPWVQETSIQSQFSRPDPNENKPALPMRDHFMRVEGSVILSSIKQSEDSAGFVVRVYNPGESPEPFKFELPHLIQDAWITNLLEEPVTACPFVKSAITGMIPPKKIHTFKITLAD